MELLWGLLRLYVLFFMLGLLWLYGGAQLGGSAMVSRAGR